MSEYRQDRSSGDWVLIAPERRGRPDEARPASQAGLSTPAYDGACPFCPGNETLLPGIIEEVRTEGTPTWSVRVVPNKFPAVRADGEPVHTDAPSSDRMPGFGHHEVVIETPRHDLDFADLDLDALRAVMTTYRSRYTALAAQPGIRHVVIFRNRGHGAGASLHHPHSQIVATSKMLPRLAAAVDWARDRHCHTGQCTTCAEIEAELTDGGRLVEATGQFVAFVPFAATGPCEIKIAPTTHQSSFADASNQALVEFGGLLQRTIERLDHLLGRQPYNFAIESAVAPLVDAKSFHWRLRLLPNLVTPGGFELAAGLPINPSLPEDDAAALRAAGGSVTPASSHRSATPHKQE